MQLLNNTLDPCFSSEMLLYCAPSINHSCIIPPCSHSSQSSCSYIENRSGRTWHLEICQIFFPTDIHANRWPYGSNYGPGSELKITKLWYLSTRNHCRNGRLWPNTSSLPISAVASYIQRPELELHESQVTPITSF